MNKTTYTEPYRSKKLSRAFSAFSLALIGGCSANYTYLDYEGSDAVKIRFITDTKNATLGYFDVQNCSGLTTGMLNNLLLRNTSRRVAMHTAAPPGTPAYLEIKVRPEQEIFFHLNSADIYGETCGGMLRFSASAGEEYELLFKQRGYNCGVGLYRLEQVEGVVKRTTQPLSYNQPFPACAGKSPLFPAENRRLPDY